MPTLQATMITKTRKEEIQLDPDTDTYSCIKAAQSAENLNYTLRYSYPQRNQNTQDCHMP